MQAMRNASHSASSRSPARASRAASPYSPGAAPPSSSARRAALNASSSREQLGVGGRPQAGDEDARVAVVGGACEPAHAHVPAGARRRPEPDRRTPAGAAGPDARRRGGVFARASCSRLREQIGHVDSRRRWRQNDVTPRV